jgi:hypothetical protein
LKRSLVAGALFALILFSSFLGIANSEISQQTEDLQYINSADKIDPAIKLYIQQRNGLENINDADIQSVIILIDENFDLTTIKMPFYVSIKNYFPLINGIFAQIQIKYVNALAKFTFVTGIWFDQSYNSLPTKQQQDEIKNFLGASGSDNDFMNFTDEIGATDLWKKGINGTKVVIAIMDSGVDITGQIGGDLGDVNGNENMTDPKFLGAVSMVPDEPLYYTDFTGVGTYHAGLASGTGLLNKSYIGVAPGANYLNVKIYDSFGLTYWSFMISGVEWALQHSADILLFCRSIPGVYIDPISLAITNAVKKGLVVVVPSGDEGPSYLSVLTPGGANGAISVGAYNMHTNTIANFSARGPGLDFRTIPDIIAPGVDLIGSRARILTNASLNLVNTMGNALGSIGISSGSNFQFSIPDGLFPQPNYGEPIDENYTRSSGTGAAAAVVAGAIALLIDAFPLANPYLLRNAICDTASSITGNLNQEGNGLINVSAAYNWLYSYFGKTQYTKLPYSVPLIYTGFITTRDSQNWTANQTDLTDITAYDMTALFSTQAMMSAIILTNGTSAETLNFTQIHLALNQFGLQYENRTHWFSEFQIAREFHQMSTVDMGDEDYNRYLGILELNGLYVSVTVESWNYIADYFTIGNNRILLDYIDRVNGFKISFRIRNLRNDKQNMTDLFLVSYFKADLFLNDTGALSTNTQGFMSILNAGLDDNITLDTKTQTMVVADSDNNTYYKYPHKFAALGFNSTSHPLYSYKITDSIQLLLNLTLNGVNDTYINNQTNYERGVQDPGFAMVYNLTDKLNYGDSVNFSSIISIGLGTDALNANLSLFEQMGYINSNVTIYPIQDLVLVKADFVRMGAKDQLYSSTALLFNEGNVRVNSSYVVFGANRTTESGDIEIYSRIRTIENFELSDYYIITQEWLPLQKGVYLVGWAIIVINGINILGMIDTEDNILNNFLSRSVYIYDDVQYHSILIDTFRVFPDKIDQEPMKIHFPGDIGLYNITTYNILSIPNVTVSLDGIGKNYMMMMWQGPDIFSGLAGGNTSGSNASAIQFNSTLYTKTLNPLSNIFLIAFGPLLCPKGFVRFNISFSSPYYGGIFYRLPVEFEFKEYRGRVFFDGIHNFLMMGTNLSDAMKGRGLQVDLNNFIDLSERLDYPYANYNDLRSMWSQVYADDKGVAVQTFFPGININMTSMLSGLNVMGQMNGTSTGGNQSISTGSIDISFITNLIGNYSFESDVISTDTINHDLLQFFDVLVINDPEMQIQEKEISDIVEWVEKGGALFVLCENKSKNQVPSLNNLLAEFNLTISEDSDMGTEIVTSIIWDNPGNIFPDNPIGTVFLKDPVRISQIAGTHGGAEKVEIPCSYIAFAERGRGRMCVIGDKDIFTNEGLMKGDNAQFAMDIIQFGLEVYFDLNITQSRNPLDMWKNNFFNAEVKNYDNTQIKTYLKEGVLFLAAFIYEDATIVNINFFGFKLPLMLMFHTDGGNYVTYYNGGWFNKTGTYYAMFLIDHAAAAQEVIYVQFEVVYAPPPPSVVYYKFPDAEYPHYLDLIGIIWCISIGLVLWIYETEKWKTRLSIVQIKGEVLNQAKTKLNEGKSLLKQILRGLDTTEDEQEQIRIVLSNRKQLSKYIKNLKKFGEDIGEHY